MKPRFIMTGDSHSSTLLGRYRCGLNETVQLLFTALPNELNSGALKVGDGPDLLQSDENRSRSLRQQLVFAFEEVCRGGRP